MDKVCPAPNHQLSRILLARSKINYHPVSPEDTLPSTQHKHPVFPPPSHPTPCIHRLSEVADNLHGTCIIHSLRSSNHYVQPLL